MKPVEKIVRAVRVVGRTIPRINWGGCGLFAYELHRALSKHGVESKLILLGDEGRRRDEPDEVTAEDILREHAYLKHIVVRVGDTLVDANGRIDISNSKFTITDESGKQTFGYDFAAEIAPDDMAELLRPSNSGIWNDMFKRRTYEADIKRLVREAVAEAVGKEEPA